MIECCKRSRVRILGLGIIEKLLRYDILIMNYRGNVSNMTKYSSHKHPIPEINLLSY